MIELILILTAAWSANEMTPAAQPSSVVAVTEQFIAADDEQNNGATQVISQPRKRLAGELLPTDFERDLVTATKLADDLGASATRSASVPTEHLVRSDNHFTSRSQQIRMEVLRPDTDERRPAILILHGASGIGDGTFYRGAAEIFAERGYVTFLPHYLTAAPATAPTKKAAAQAKQDKSKHGKTTEEPRPTADIRSDFQHQKQIVQDALDAIALNPYVDAAHIGVFGMSLGGFHALDLSSRDYRIDAVVNMSGALRGNNLPESNHLPPTLALHGAKDNLVPVSRARSLDKYLKTLGVPHEVVIYPDQGHFFRGKAQTDALQRSADFFGNYLSPDTGSAATRSGSR
jgi:dienelactone hydrolase